MNKLLLLVIALLVYTGDSFCSPVYSGDEDMPSWFYVPTGVIGVSDMYLDEEDALNQAIGRALFMQAVSEKLEIASVYELYYHFENGRKNCVDDQKSHCFAEFKADLVDYDYDVLDVYYTEYEEAVVLLNVYHGNDDGVQKNATFSGSYMFYFDGTIRYPEFGDMLMLECNTPDEEVKSSEWLARTENASTTVYSTTDSENERILEKYYTYSNGGDKSENAVSQNTRHGLWHCFTDTFMQALSNFIPRKTVMSSTNRMISDFQSLNEDAEYSDKVQDLARMTYKTDVFCDINGLSSEKGNLYVDWNIVEAGMPEEETDGGKAYNYEIEGYQAVVGSDYSKAKNESRRIALICAANEIAKMAKFSVSGAATDFTIGDEDEFYTRYCDTTQISTMLIMKDMEEIRIVEPELKNGVYCSKIKARVNRNNVLQLNKNRK